MFFNLTEKLHGLLISAETVLRRTLVVAVVRRRDVVDAKVECEPVVDVVVVVDVDGMTVGRRDALVVTLPVVGNVRSGVHNALEDGLAMACLAKTAGRHRDPWCN